MDNAVMSPEDRLASQAGLPRATNMNALSMAQIRDVGQVMAASGMFPDIRSGAQAFVKILAGQEMGVGPFQAMSDISIIKGKAAAGGNIHASKVKGNLKYDYRVKKWDNDGCAIEFFEILPGGNRESLGISEFTKQDAVTAGLASGENYRKYPKNMFFNRAMTGGVRTYCPDALNGVNAYTPEELGATIDEDGNPVVVTYIPNKKEAPKIAPPVTADEEPTDKPIKREGNPLQMISFYLEEQGFTDKAERGSIALGVGDVTSFDELNANQWHEIYELIVTMSEEDLRSFLTVEEDLPANQIDEVAEVTDEELAATENGTILDETTESVTLDPPKPKEAPVAATNKKPTAKQIAKVSSLYVKRKIKTEPAKADYNEKAIGKRFPVTAEDFDALILALETEIHEPEAV